LVRGHRDPRPGSINDLGKGEAHEASHDAFFVTMAHRAVAISERIRTTALVVDSTAPGHSAAVCAFIKIGYCYPMVTPRPQHFQHGPLTSVEASIANISLKSDDAVHFLVKTGAQPAEDYSDYEVGYATKNHAAEVAGGSDIYVSVRDNASGGTHTVTVVHQEVAETVTETVDRHLSASGAVGKGEWSGTYIQPVAAGETIHVCTTSEQDVDLYVRFAAAPTASDYDARGYTWSGNESASVTASEDSLLYIKTLGYHNVRSYTVYTAETGCK
jgi:hypothetical protein